MAASGSGASAGGMSLGGSSGVAGGPSTHGNADIEKWDHEGWEAL